MNLPWPWSITAPCIITVSIYCVQGLWQVSRQVKWVTDQLIRTKATRNLANMWPAPQVRPHYLHIYHHWFTINWIFAVTEVWIGERWPFWMFPALKVLLKYEIVYCYGMTDVFFLLKSKQLSQAVRSRACLTVSCKILNTLSYVQLLFRIHKNFNK